MIVFHNPASALNPANGTISGKHPVFDDLQIFFILDMCLYCAEKFLIVIGMNDLFQKSAVDQSVRRRVTGKFTVVRAQIEAIGFQIPIPETLLGNAENQLLPLTVFIHRLYTLPEIPFLFFNPITGSIYKVRN